MADGSDAIADWPLLNALVNTSSGATWVSIHHGGGVGIGRSIHAGMVALADGTDLAAEKLERVLTTDPGTGVIRHADAGYDRAIEVAAERDVRLPMRECDAEPLPRQRIGLRRICGRLGAVIIEGDFERDGAVCVRGAVDARARRPGPARPSTPTSPTCRRGPSGPAPTTTARSSRTSATGSGCRRCERFIRDVRRRRDRRRADGLADGAAVPRPRAGQGARHPPAHAVAPGPAVLQRRRPPERQHVVPRRPGAARRRRSSSSPARTAASGTCRARSSTTRPSGSPTARWPSCPTSTADPTTSAILGWELEPGDAVFFHMLTLHAAGGVPGPHRRRVLSVRFLGDDIVHAPRPWTTSPPFPGLVDELPAGAPMDHPLFPSSGQRDANGGRPHERTDRLRRAARRRSRRRPRTFYAAAFGWSFQRLRARVRRARQDAGLDGGFDANDRRPARRRW